jgi:hypothetical protein
MTASCHAVAAESQRVHCFSTRRALKHLVLLGLLLVPLVSCSLHTPAPSQAGDLTRKIFDAYGGRERLSQIGSIAVEGTITALVRGDHGVYRRALRRDGKLFVDIQYTRSRETRVLNGTRAIRGVDGKMEEVSGPSYLAMVYQYNELSMPFALLDDSFTVKDLGSVSLADVPVRVLRCTDKAGNSLDVFVHEVSYRIVKTLGRFSMGKESSNLSAEFSDFKFFEGVLVPFRIVNYAGDTRISELIIEDYLFNGRFSDAMFDPYSHSQNPSSD